MLSKRMLCLVLCCLCLMSATGTAFAAQVECDSVYCFSSGDFSDQADLRGVCITELPRSDLGTVFLGTRVVRSGDILSADQLQKLTFMPLRTEEDQVVTVTYLPIYENRVEAATTMTISILGKEDKAPVAQDSTLETYKNLPNTGKLDAADPEGQQLVYSILRQPKRGQLQVNEDGTFTYTPKKNKVGTDSFTYTATDPAGNVSRTATVTVQILKPKDKTQYADTLGNSCRFAAEWMKNTGLFVGETLGGQACFQPDKAVSRGEFLAMLVDMLDIPVDPAATTTGFTDDIPTWLKPYLAAALRTGLTDHWPHAQTFGASQPITGQEAALLLQNALDLPSQTQGDSVATWTEDALQVLAHNGLPMAADQPLDRAQTAQILYTASKLAQNAPGIPVFSQT